MLDRGWHQNTDGNSRIFDLKYVKMGKDVHTNNGTFHPIYDWQKVNKLIGVGHFTSKARITMNLKVLPEDYYE